MDRKVIRKTRKSRQAANTGKTRDVFTAICKTELGVECVKEYRFHKARRWRFDYALPLYKIAVEVEGGVWSRGRHVRPQGFLGDMQKYNTAALLGWRVFRTTPDKLAGSDMIMLLKNAISGSFSTQKECF